MTRQFAKIVYVATFAVIAAIFATPSRGQSYDFSLKQSDASGTSSFNKKLNWVDALSVAAVNDPGPGYTYYVGNIFSLRTPENVASATFLGDRLIIDDNAFMGWKGSNNGFVRIPDLVLRGTIAHSQDYNTGTLRGVFTIPGGANAMIRIIDANWRTFIVEADLAGSGALTLNVNSSDSSLKTMKLYGDNSAFTGSLSMVGRNATYSRVAITNEVNLGAAPAVFTPNHVTLNNLTFVLDNAKLTAPERGIWLNTNGASFEVADGCDASIASVIGGVGAFTKTGAGLLALGATNTYSGATTITAGTLCFNATNNSPVTVQAAGAIGGTGVVNSAVSFANGASVTLAGNGYGTLTLANLAGASLNNAALSFDLRDPFDGVSDRLEIVGALTLSGACVITFNMPPDGLPAGEYELVKFASRAGAGSVATTMNYPGTALVTTSTNIVFKIDKGLYNIALESLPAIKIGSVSAVLPANVTAVPNVGGVLRVYYGTGDGGDVESAWTTHTDYGPANAAGSYAVTVGGLTLGETYRYRHAYVVNGTDVFFAPATLSFTTVDENLANVFWYGTPRTGTLDWDAPGAWIPNNNAFREVPGKAGDTVQPAAAMGMWENSAAVTYNRTLLLTNDITLGTIVTAFYARNWDATHNFALRRNASATDPVVVTLDAGATRGNSRVQLGSSERAWFGYDDFNNTDFTLRLTQPVVFHKNGNLNTDVFMNAHITGGTENEPCSITISATAGDTFYRFSPRNINNDFVGDIILHSTWMRCGLHLGAALESNLPGNNNGYNSWDPKDEFLGDPANRIIMTHPSCRLAIHNANANGGFVINRTILGTGMIRASQMPWWNANEEDASNGRHNLYFGSRCVLSPGFNAADLPLINAGLASIGIFDQWNPRPVPPVVEGVGVLTLRGANLNMDSATRVILNVTPDSGVNDSIALQFDGAVNFNRAVLEIVEQGHIRVGTTWTIFTTAEFVPTLDGTFKTPLGYKVDYNNASGIPGKLTSITLTKLSPGTLIIVK